MVPPIKIKIVGKALRKLGGGRSRAQRVDQDLRPYHMRVTRDHGGGLWTIEDNTGQLYLAVLSNENSANRRRLDEERRAKGYPRYTG